MRLKEATVVIRATATEPQGAHHRHGLAAPHRLPQVAIAHHHAAQGQVRARHQGFGPSSATWNRYTLLFYIVLNTYIISYYIVLYISWYDHVYDLSL